MAGRRRVQRSARGVAAAGLVATAAIGVVAALVTGALLTVAAGWAVVAAGVAARIMAAEVRQTRRAAALQHADQARAWSRAFEATRADQAAYTELVERLLAQRGATIDALTIDLRIARRRVGDAERLLEAAERRTGEADARARAEARRCQQAEQQLATLLDEVLGTGPGDVDADRQGLPAARATAVRSPGWDVRLTA